MKQDAYLCMYIQSLMWKNIWLDIELTATRQICTLDEWTNFLERMNGPKHAYAEKDKRMDLVRQWVSYRGQTLT